MSLFGIAPRLCGYAALPCLHFLPHPSASSALLARGCTSAHSMERARSPYREFPSRWKCRECDLILVGEESEVLCPICGISMYPLLPEPLPGPVNTAQANVDSENEDGGNPPPTLLASGLLCDCRWCCDPQLGGHCTSIVVATCKIQGCADCMSFRHQESLREWEAHATANEVLHPAATSLSAHGPFQAASSGPLPQQETDSVSHSPPTGPLHVAGQMAHTSDEETDEELPALNDRDTQAANK